MFGLGLWEIALILVIGLLVLGPEKLPKVARQLAHVLRDVRRAAQDFQTNLSHAMEEDTHQVQPEQRLEKTAEKTPSLTLGEEVSSNESPGEATE